MKKGHIYHVQHFGVMPQDIHVRGMRLIHLRGGSAAAVLSWIVNPSVNAQSERNSSVEGLAGISGRVVAHLSRIQMPQPQRRLSICLNSSMIQT